MVKSYYIATYSVTAMKNLDGRESGGQWVPDGKAHYETFRFNSHSGRSAVKRVKEDRPDFHNKYLGPDAQLIKLEKILKDHKRTAIELN